MREARRPMHGFTLVEMVVTIVVMAIALVTVSSLIGLGTANSADTLLETRAIALAQSYLDEIMGRRFDERSAASGLDPCFGTMGADPNRCSSAFGPDGGETLRERYDDVDDYDGLTEGDGVPGQPIADAEGNARPEYENFYVTVSVRYAGDDLVLGLDPTDAKLITVSVQHRAQDVGWDFSVYRTNY